MDDVSCKIFVGSIDFNASEKDVEDAFRPFGEILHTVLLRDKETQKSRGFGFITFKDKESVEAAIQGMNHKLLMGRQIVVNYASRKGSSNSGASQDASGYNSQQNQNFSGYQAQQQNPYYQGYPNQQGYGWNQQGYGMWGQQQGYWPQAYQNWTQQGAWGQQQQQPQQQQQQQQQQPTAQGSNGYQQTQSYNNTMNYGGGSTGSGY